MKLETLPDQWTSERHYKFCRHLMVMCNLHMPADNFRLDHLRQVRFRWHNHWPFTIMPDICKKLSIFSTFECFWILSVLSLIRCQSPNSFSEHVAWLPLELIDWSRWFVARISCKANGKKVCKINRCKWNHRSWSLYNLILSSSLLWKVHCIPGYKICVNIISVSMSATNGNK